MQDAPTILSCYKQHQFIQQDPEDTIALFEGSLNPGSISGYTGIVLSGHSDCLFSRIKWHAEKHQRYSSSPFTCSQGVPAASSSYQCWAGVRNCTDPGGYQEVLKIHYHCSQQIEFPILINSHTVHNFFEKDK